MVVCTLKSSLEFYLRSFQGGRTVSEQAADESTRVIRALNQRVASDSRLISSIFPAGDGTLVALKVA